MSRWTLLAVAGYLICPVTLAGQNADSSEPFDVVGYVMEAGSDRPIEGALVELGGSDIKVVTDFGGRFILSDVETRTYELRVAILGYADLHQQVTIAPGGVLDVRLLPKPVILEGLTVVSDRLKQRMDALAYTVHVAEGMELRASVYANASEFLMQRMGAIPAECRVEVPGYPSCLLVRGRARPFRLYVDDNPLPGGLDWLSTYQVYDLERVEFLPTLGQVRVYTGGYLERLAETGRRVQPICIVCVPG